MIHANLDAPETATVTVRTGQGTFSFKPAELKRSERTLFLDGQASVERQEAAVRLTGAGTEDDFPAAARAADGTVWLAYVEYTPEVAHLTKAASKKEFDSLVPTKHGDRIRLRSFDGNTWQPGMDVTGRRARRLAADRGGRRPGEGLGRLGTAGRRRLGDLPPDLHPARARRGHGVVVRDRSGSPTRRGRTSTSSPRPTRRAASGSPGRRFAATTTRSSRSRCPNGRSCPQPEPSVVSASPADDWGPAIAADGQGGVFVAWDTYDKGNFDVMLRDVGRDGPPVAVAVVVAVRGAAAAWRATRGPGLGRLRGGRRAVGQGLTPTRATSRTSAWRRTRGSPSTSIGRSS